MTSSKPKGHLTIVNGAEYFIGVLEATEEYFEKNEEFTEEINEYFWRFRSLFDLLPQTLEKFWSGHVFPFTEAEYEFECSIAFVEMGYYKHAIAALRSVLELGILSVYFDVDDKSEVDIKGWLNSAEPTPFRKNVQKKLLKHPNIYFFSQHYPIFNKFEILYGKLCDYSHTRGARYSSRKLSLSNTNRFHEKSLSLWFGLVKEVVEVIAIFHLLKYPIGLQETPIEEKFGINGPAGGFLQPFQSENLKKIIQKDALRILQKISDQDPDVQGVLKWIRSFEDITEEELKKQFEESDKLTIEGGGLEQWLKNQEVLLNNLPQNLNIPPAQTEEKRKYVEKMTRWAKENGYDKKWGYGSTRSDVP